MTIHMNKIGITLTSRPAGREAYLAMQPTLNAQETKNIIIDFEGVLSMGPSFADEFITKLLEDDYNITMKNTDNAAVTKVLEFLAPEWKENGYSYQEK